MVTKFPFPYAGLALLCACGTASRTPTNVGEGPNPKDPLNIDVPNTGAHYQPAEGFVVHEWGTNTIVVGTNGKLLPGLHHEEEDLPEFVFDRMKVAKLGGPVEVKMETPVTYFYAPHAMTANVSVSFPKGVFTQWYPGTASFYPMLAISPITQEVGDPLDPHFQFGSQVCAAKYGAVQNGLLDWGTVEILNPEATPNAPSAALDQYTWSFARQVAANPVRVVQPGKGQGDANQEERFLFYRGLGNNLLPVNITSEGESVTMQNVAPAPMGTVFVLRVTATGGAFKEHGEGIGATSSLSETPPAANALLPMQDFKAALGKAVVGALDRTGLYHDESMAMVNTWQRQWFATPGVRVLYLMPQSLTEEQIPLTVTPAPSKTVRVMMIRAELLTPTIESEDSTFAGQLDGAGASDAKSHFVGLGRFAEPRLRRAMDQLAQPSAGASQLLEEIKATQGTETVE